MNEYILKEYRKRSLWGDVWIRLRKNKSAIAGAVLFIVIVIACMVSPLFYSFESDIIALDVPNQFQGPTSAHFLGVDELGRDILARILWGGRTTLIVSFCALCIAFVFGAIIGTAAAYYGRATDMVIMRIIDVIMAIPPILIMITLATVINPSSFSMMFVVGIGLIPNQSRLIRGQILQVVDREYIEAVRVEGASNLKIIISHILPNAISPIITTILLDMSWAVMTISTLSFLGLGIQAPNPEWGGMLASGRQYIRQAWHITTFPGIALVLTVMSITLVGDGLRDALDPKMKR